MQYVLSSVTTGTRKSINYTNLSLLWTLWHTINLVPCTKKLLPQTTFALKYDTVVPFSTSTFASCFVVFKLLHCYLYQWNILCALQRNGSNLFHHGRPTIQDLGSNKFIPFCVLNNLKSTLLNVHTIHILVFQSSMFFYSSLQAHVVPNLFQTDAFFNFVITRKNQTQWIGTCNDRWVVSWCAWNAIHPSPDKWLMNLCFSAYNAI